MRHTLKLSFIPEQLISFCEYKQRWNKHVIVRIVYWLLIVNNRLVVTVILLWSKVVVDSWNKKIILTHFQGSFAQPNNHILTRALRELWIICKARSVLPKIDINTKFPPALMQARASPVPVPLRNMVLTGTPYWLAWAKAAATFGLRRSYRQTSFLSQGSC